MVALAVPAVAADSQEASQWVTHAGASPQARVLQLPSLSLVGSSVSGSLGGLSYAGSLPGGLATTGLPPSTFCWQPPDGPVPWDWLPDWSQPGCPEPGPYATAATLGWVMRRELLLIGALVLFATGVLTVKRGS